MHRSEYVYHYCQTYVRLSLQTPPYEEIAVDLMHTLKPRQIFLGRSKYEFDCSSV